MISKLSIVCAVAILAGCGQPNDEAVSPARKVYLSLLRCADHDQDTEAMIQSLRPIASVYNRTEDDQDRLTVEDLRDIYSNRLSVADGSAFVVYTNLVSLQFPIGGHARIQAVVVGRGVP